MTKSAVNITDDDDIIIMLVNLLIIIFTKHLNESFTKIPRKVDLGFGFRRETRRLQDLFSAFGEKFFEESLRMRPDSFRLLLIILGSALEKDAHMGMLAKRPIISP